MNDDDGIDGIPNILYEMQFRLMAEANGNLRALEARGDIAPLDETLARVTAACQKCHIWFPIAEKIVIWHPEDRVVTAELGVRGA